MSLRLHNQIKLKLEIMENTEKLQLVERKMLNYMHKTSKHLFINESDEFIKVLPVKVNDEWRAFGIMFGNGDVYITERDMKAKSTQSLFFLKTSFFPQWETRTSIPNFKSMRVSMLEVVKAIQKYYDDKDLMKAEIKNILKNQTFLKKDLTSE
jgi:hypothetical protein